ncbi:MAG: acyl-CoA thioesterase/bile acid-CoA:amino acid N-acyltransferase family protein [Pseudomonadota bacterium]
MSFFRSLSLVFAVLCAAPATALELTVSPSDRLWTEDGAIIVSDAEPGAEVALIATLTDENGVVWSSRSVYFADNTGRVEVSRAASVGGTYKGVDPHGPFWSLLPADPEEIESQSAEDISPTAPRVPRLSSERPASVFLTAITGESEANDSVTLRMVGSDVGIHEVNEAGLRGRYFSPSGEGSHSAVLIVTGSGGGVNARAAGILASEGFAVFALAHFGYEGRPDELANIPLEYFETAINWLRAEAGVDKVGLLGNSRGGEAVLLIASTFPDHVGAVMSGVPSNVIWGGCCTAAAVKEPAWTLDGNPLPYSPYPFEEDRWGFEYLTDSVGFRDFYMPGMMGSSDDNAATIAVENIRAPILLQSGAADLMWPSSIAAEQIVGRLTAKNFAYPVENYVYPAGGHRVTFGIPVTIRASEVTHPVTGTTMYLGGDPAANAEGGRLSFERTVAFFDKYLNAAED